MYQRFYGLRELPFELTPNPKFLFLTPRHREALSNLQYGMSSAKPLTVMVGEAGTGKTTLLRTVLESEQCRHVRWVCLNNPVLTREDFVKTLAARFELSAEAVWGMVAFATVPVLASFGALFAAWESRRPPATAPWDAIDVARIGGSAE